MIRAFAIALAILSSPALAETVVVRSGDHADFSRLLLDGNIGNRWVFGTAEGGFEFRPERDDVTWDLSRVFDRIGHDRIAALDDLGNGRLLIEIGCDCHADAFFLRDGQVVLDIKDGPPPTPLSEFNLPLEAVAQPEARGQAGATPVVPLENESFGSRGGLPLVLSLPKTVSDNTRARGAQIPSPETFDVAPLHRPNPRVAETEAALVEQLARAVAQGLVEADTDRIENATRAPVQIAQTQVPRQPVPPPPLPPPPVAPPHGHVSVETGVDRAAPAAEQIAATDEGNECLDPSLFAISEWGGSLDRGAELGMYRSKLLGEFDQADSAAITALAHYYLYLSFGAETVALLRKFPSSVERADLLFQMAAVMDFRQAEGADRLIPQMACDGATALWAALAQPEFQKSQTINTQAVTLAFTSLPPHLRGLLGPGLANKFIKIGDTATAERIRGALERAVDPGNPGLELTMARLDLALGDPERAAETLDEVAAQDSDLLPAALLERVNATLAGGQAIAPEKIALLQSLAFEHQGTPLGAELLEAEVEAQAIAGDFTAAFDGLAAARSDAFVTPDHADHLAAAVFSALSENAADAAFLLHAVPHMESAFSIPAHVRRQVAKRFIALGLTEPARRVLAGNGALPDKDDRLLFAQAALAESRPGVAVGYLAGLKGETADLLRAQALEAAGDYTGAAKVYDAVGNPARATWADWRGGAWGDLAARESGVLSVVANAMQTQDEVNSGAGQITDVTTSDTPLAQARQLIEQSQAERSTLDDLLETIAPVQVSAGS